MMTKEALIARGKKISLAKMGYKVSKATRAKIRKKLLGVPLSPERCETLRRVALDPIVQAKRYTPERNKKLSIALTGMKPSKQSKEKNRLWHLGRKASQETKKKMSQSHGKGENCATWKGGRHISKAGYINVYIENHPYTTKRKKYIFEHRLVMERHIGRYLLPCEVVHHINKDVADNRIENLILFPSAKEHQKHHQRLIRELHDRQRVVIN